MIEVEPLRITREILLNNNSEESYMTFYTGVNPTRGLFLSPIRADHKPTACFYRSRHNGELVLKDFGGDGFHGNFISVVMRLHNLKYNEALMMIAHDFGIIKRPDRTVNQPKAIYNGEQLSDEDGVRIQCKIKEFTEKELEWWRGFGITPATLAKFNVFSIEHVFLNSNLHATSSPSNPIFGYYFGTVDGFEHWKIYFPFKTQYRFLLNTNALQGAAQLPLKCDSIVVTKSMKDVMTLYELGVSAVAPQAESVVLSAKRIEFLQKRTNIIITNGDWDRAGQLFMAKSRRLYPTRCLSFKDKVKYGKDISDFVKLHGIDKAQKLVVHIENLVKKGALDRHLDYFVPGEELQI